MYKSKRRFNPYMLALLVATFSYVGTVQAVERTCGTHVRTDAEKQQSEQRFAMESSLAYKTFPPVNKPITIPVRVHVIQSTSGKGNVSNTVLKKQITVLNNAYQGSGFRFSLKSVDRTKNNTWFNRCMSSSAVERKYKNALAIDPAHNLNVYTCTNSNGILGFATFPDDHGSETSKMHGVVLNYQSLPGNSGPYGKGDTATHEVGHYLGLYHTFDDSYKGNCSKDNDLVADTAIEGKPAFGCPVKLDTCPTKIGKDPIVNYMDYSYDSCMTSFSLGQIQRMQKQVVAFRPSLIP